MERLAALAALALRHAGAYSDLMLSDIDATRRALHQRVIAGTVMVGATVLAGAIACAGVIAVTWDTGARIWSIAALFGVFVLVAALALWRLAILRGAEPGLFAQSAREWDKDRQLLEELLARERTRRS